MAVPTSPLPVCRFAGLLAGSEEQLAAARHKEDVPHELSEMPLADGTRHV